MADIAGGEQPQAQQQQQTTETTDGYDYKRLHNYPLVKVRTFSMACALGSVLLQSCGSACFTITAATVPQYSDMNEEMRMEAMELCVTACEKHGSNNEVSLLCLCVCMCANCYWMCHVSCSLQPSLLKRRWTRSLAVLGMRW